MRVRLVLGIALVFAVVAGVLDRGASGTVVAPAKGTQTVAGIKHVSTGGLTAATIGGFRQLAGGLAVDASGNLNVSFENSAGRVEVAVLAPDGRLLRRWDPTGGASVGNPTLLAVGADGLVYVRNRNESRIRVYRSDGTFVRDFGRTVISPNAFGDLEVDAAGNIYVVSLDKIVRFNTSGAVSGQFTAVAGLHSSDRLTGIAVAPDGSMYVTVDVRQNPTPAEKLPLLAHIDASGNRLPDPAPLLHKLVGVEKNFGFTPQDIDYSEGRLYLAGNAKVLGVLTTEGRLIDTLQTGGSELVAARGRELYVTGIRTTAFHTQAQNAFVIGRFHGEDVYAPPGFTTMTGCDGAGENITSPEAGQSVPHLVFPGKPSGCSVSVGQSQNPCPSGSNAAPAGVYIGGRLIPREGLFDFGPNGSGGLFFSIPATELESGDVLVRWSCQDKQTGALTDRWEWKGRMTGLTDPSGHVVDAKTGRPVAHATVKLEFSPTKSGPFGIPSPRAHMPQANPLPTGKDGFFGWDVADGYWRLRITAFGYKPYTSAVYKVPPEVTGLKLKLKPDPSKQKLVVDPYTGRAGLARLGSKPGRVSGLKLKVVRGRIRSIAVRAKKYRTVEGVSLGSSLTDLFQAYAPKRADFLRIEKATKSTTYRVGKATFTLKRGRVSAIVLGR